MENLVKDIALTYDRENRGIPRLIARHIITLTPQITNSSVIHDNACGPAIVTSEILSKASGDSLPSVVESTDIAPPMIEASKNIIQTNNWNVANAAVLDSQKLSFENDTFTHSFTNFLIPSTPAARSEIYRTLKPGGTAVYTMWKFQGFVDLIQRCSKTLSKVDGVTSGASLWPTEEAMRGEFEAAGFGKQDIEVQSHHEKLPFENLDDLLSLARGPFGKFLTKSWSEEDVAKLPETIEKVLTVEESEKKSLDMVAWVVIGKKH